MDNTTQKIESTSQEEGKKSWIKRLGWGGFWFFLIKGVVLYILLPFLAWVFGVDILHHIKSFFTELF